MMKQNIRRLSNITGALGIIIIGTSGCNLSDVTGSSGSLDEGVINQDAVESPEGAKWIYLGSIARFNGLLAAQAGAVGRFTDEISVLPHVRQEDLDVRIGRRGSGSLLGEVPFVVPSSLAGIAQETRVQIGHAIELLNDHIPGADQTMQAHMYGLLGMVHLILADNFCSGVPLSMSNYGGEFVPGSGVSTDSVYQRAIELFDIGLSLHTDSVAIKTLLYVGKARALNSLGRFDEAAATAANVSDRDSVWVRYSARRPTETNLVSYPVFPGGFLDTLSFHVINGKGTNGIRWLSDEASSQDLRVPVVTYDTIYPDSAIPVKRYRLPVRPVFFDTDRTIAFASGLEARLIEAEAALQANDITAFIDKINSVRKHYKTLGGLQLADTTDPGSAAGRIDLLFRERAYTFFMTGRRLGDYRRLIRQYNRIPANVYPVGRSEGSDVVFYGSNYVFAPEVPGNGQESNYNPFYFECESYDP